jgi:hypothetical protein
VETGYCVVETILVFHVSYHKHGGLSSSNVLSYSSKVGQTEVSVRKSKVSPGCVPFWSLSRGQKIPSTLVGRIQFLACVGGSKFPVFFLVAN